MKQTRATQRGFGILMQRRKGETGILVQRAVDRATVVRESMSACEDGIMRSTLQSDGTRKLECTTVSPFNGSE